MSRNHNFPIKHSLIYIGDRPNVRPEQAWLVDVCNPNNGGISFFYFATREEAIAVYPDVAEPYHCDQCGEFFRSKELHELSHQEAQ